ncbi:MAG: rRNA maturation RNase YbeY [Rhodocyclaceae bacterium]|nr:rRNA maturation RNase YbeY [Rhodocyclaceae bacterium]
MKHSLSLTVQYACLTTHDRCPLVSNETTRQAGMCCSTLSEGLPSRPQVRRWVRAATLHSALTLTVRFVDEEEGRTLNHQYRGKETATNVLSFDYEDPPGGDIVLCVPVVLREAREQKKTPEAHFAHLIVHGTLHLQGYDHETTPDAELMERQECKLLARLGYPNPYE